MRKKIYLETLKKCPGSLCFPLLKFCRMYFIQTLFEFSTIVYDCQITNRTENIIDFPGFYKDFSLCFQAPFILIAMKNK